MCIRDSGGGGAAAAAAADGIAGHGHCAGEGGVSEDGAASAEGERERPIGKAAIGRGWGELGEQGEDERPVRHAVDCSGEMRCSRSRIIIMMLANILFYFVMYCYISTSRSEDVVPLASLS
eukprot:246579-Prymnesium_polylepis.1